MRRQPRRGVLAAIAVLAIAAAGCASGRAGGGVASLPGHPATARASQAQTFTQLVRFARCMRSHGINVPDPVPGRPFPISTSVDPASAAALQACRNLMPAPDSGTGTSQRGLPAADLPALITYARCMRGHDISMLDPTSYGALNLGPVPGITNDFGRYSPQFRAADAACRHLLPAGVRDDGTGP